MHPNQFAMRRPRLRRLGAWLGILAIFGHLLLMATHQPASAAPVQQLAEHCAESSDAHPHQAPVHHQDGGGLAHHAKFCAICSAMHAAAPPPQAPFVVAIPWATADIVVSLAADTPPPHLVLTDLNPRGPPSLG